MIIFPIYAVFIWYLAMRFRRRAVGFVLVLAGAALCFLLAKFLGGIEDSPNHGLRIFSHLVWGEAAIILGVGLFISCLPRPPTGRHCAYCWYDLAGLNADEMGRLVCPECGAPRDGWGRKRVEVRTIKTTPPIP